MNLILIVMPSSRDCPIVRFSTEQLIRGADLSPHPTAEGVEMSCPAGVRFCNVSIYYSCYQNNRTLIILVAKIGLKICHTAIASWWNVHLSCTTAQPDHHVMAEHMGVTGWNRSMWKFQFHVFTLQNLVSCGWNSCFVVAKSRSKNSCWIAWRLKMGPYVVPKRR